MCVGGGESAAACVGSVAVCLWSVAVCLESVTVCVGSVVVSVESVAMAVLTNSGGCVFAALPYVQPVWVMCGTPGLASMALSFVSPH